MKLIYYSIFLLAIILYSCKSDSPVSNDPPVNSVYTKIFTKDTNNIRFEIWSASASNLVYGYNDIGFKVFINNVEQKSGFVKFPIKMYHFFPNSPYHASPISNNFPYNNEKSVFAGYVIFTMVPDTQSAWYGFFNYNDQNLIDSVYFPVVSSSVNKVLAFADNIGGYTYLSTLVSPLYPRQGLNDFKCLLHRTTDDKNYEQIDAAQMYIFPWMPQMGHGSSGNENPVFIGGGIYQGKVNFNMPGTWTVADSIYYENRFITPVPSPKFTFDVQ